MPKKNMLRITTPTSPKGLLTLPQAAAYLNLSEGTLRNWVSERRVAYVKVGSKTHFRQAALDAYIDAHTFPAVAEAK